MSSTVFFEVTRGIFHVLLVSALIIGSIRFKKLSFDQRILVCLLVCTLVVEVVSVLLWRFKMNNNFLYHVYSVFEIFFLGTLYARNLQGLLQPVYVNVCIVFLGLFALVNTLFFQSLKEFNSNVTFVESLLLIILSMLYFYKLLRDLEHRKLEREPMFWINMSVLTYFSGALLLFHVANELLPLPEDERAAIWGTHALFNIVHYLLYGMALGVRPQKSQAPSSREN
jgi:hypothetical protein